MVVPPIFDYDDRYFQESPYTRDQLFEIQRKLLSLTNSTDLEKDMLLDSDVDITHIRFILDIAHKKGIINKIRIKPLHNHYFYKYDYPNEKMFEWEKKINDRSNRP